MAPMVFAAIGMNEYDCVNDAYLVIFLFAAASAAAPGVCDDIGRYDCAIVSVTVTSHVTHLPLFHGINVTPSGRLPSVLNRPDGSLTAGISAFERAR